MTMPCPNCGEGLETPLACGACGVLHDVPSGGAEAPTPFAILGLQPSIEVDAADARKRLRRFTRLVHPDFFALAGAEQLQLAESHNARLNSAHDLATDFVACADWLVGHLGGPDEKELGAMPQAFLMEVMEWNEIFDEHPAGSPELDSLVAELTSRRSSLVASIKTALAPLPPEGDASLQEVRKLLNAMRYVDRAIQRAAGQAPPL